MIYDAINGMTARARTIGCLLASAVICMSTLCAQVRAATPLNQSERLRRLARLPQVELNSPLTFNPFSGFDLLQDRLSMQREAEALKLILSESPSDAMRYVRLGLICREIGDSGTAKVAFSAAARLFERQGADSSVDGPTLAAYGEAMAGMGKAEAAERILRKSVRAAELEWKTHAALARFLTERVASSAVDGQKTLIGPGSDLAWLANARSSSLQPERLERFQEEIVTAVTALERAIELAPTEAEPRVWRAAAKSVEQYLAGMSGEWQSAGQDPIKRLATLFPPKLAIDMAEAAKLSPTNARVAAMSAVYPILCSLRATNPQAGGTLQLHEAWESVPNDVRAQVRQTMSRLASLAEADEPRTAASAMEMLGNIQLFVFNDPNGAENSLRRAISLDPERDREALATLLIDSGRWNELVEFAEAILDRKDDVRSRLLFVKGLEKLGKIGEMAAVVLETHRRYPEDFHANLALALTLIRISNEPVSLSQALTLILRAEKAAGRRPSRHQLTELLFARGLVMALDNQIDAARTCFKRVIDLDPHNVEARQAIEIIDLGG